MRLCFCACISILFVTSVRPTAAFDNRNTQQRWHSRHWRLSFRRTKISVRRRNRDEFPRFVAWKSDSRFHWSFENAANNFIFGARKTLHAAECFGGNLGPCFQFSCLPNLLRCVLFRCIGCYLRRSAY